MRDYSATTIAPHNVTAPAILSYLKIGLLYVFICGPTQRRISDPLMQACLPVCAAIKAATSQTALLFPPSASGNTHFGETRVSMSVALRTQLLLVLISLSSRIGHSRYIEVRAFRFNSSI